MDQSDTLRNIVIAFAVFLTVMLLGPRLLPTPPARPALPPAGPDSASLKTPASGPPAESPVGRKAEIGSPAAPSAPVERADGETFTVIEAATEQTREMGAPHDDVVTKKDAASVPYRMRLTVSSVGASIESAALTDHAEAIDDPARYVLMHPIERDDGARFRSLAIDSVNIDDVIVALYDKNWNVGPVTPYESEAGGKGQRVEFRIEIHEKGTPALRLTRTLTLPRQSSESGRHDLKADLAIENLSDRPHRILVAYRGGLGIPRAASRMDDRSVDYGLRSEGIVSGVRKTQSQIASRAPEPVELYSSASVAPGTRVSWAATANTYFTCTIAPLNHDRSGEAENITRVQAIDVDGSSATDDDVTVRFVTRPETIAPGGKLDYPIDVYIGEKDGRTFKSEPDYESRNYYFQISQGFGSCTFTWLVEFMVWLLNSLYFIVHDFGVGIVILVLIVRAILHPITKKGQVNMVRMQHRMQELAPKIEEIKKKFANDKTRMNQELMKLNMNPAGQLLTCLPMVIQMPIWIALYLSLSNNILMRHEPFHLTWIKDLTSPDALWTFSSPIVVPFVGWVLPSFNLLPLLVALFMYTQQKLQPKPAPSPNMSDQQRQQQEMMQNMMPLMSIMMLVIFYKMPAGLNLYIMTSSLFGTLEQKRIRSHIKEREEAGTLHKPVKPSGAKPAMSDGKPRKPSWLSSRLAKLQDMAEEARTAQAKRPRGGKRRK